MAAHLLAAQCTFSPEINSRSRRMAAATPLEELYANSKGRALRAAVAAELDARREAECTFAPDTSKARGWGGGGGSCGGAGAGAGSPGRGAAGHAISCEEEQELVERLYTKARPGSPGRCAARASASPAGPRAPPRASTSAAEAEMAELAECTFEPNARGRPAPVPQPQGPVVIKGLGRYLELKDMAARQRAEHEAREARVFVKHPRTPATPFTRPAPFRLATAGEGDGGAALAARSGARRARAEREAAAAACGECTFSPALRRRSGGGAACEGSYARITAGGSGGGGFGGERDRGGGSDDDDDDDDGPGLEVRRLIAAVRAGLAPPPPAAVATP